MVLCIVTSCQCMRMMIDESNLSLRLLPDLSLPALFQIQDPIVLPYLQYSEATDPTHGRQLPAQNVRAYEWTKWLVSYVAKQNIELHSWILLPRGSILSARHALFNHKQYCQQLHNYAAVAHSINIRYIIPILFGCDIQSVRAIGQPIDQKYYDEIGSVWTCQHNHYQTIWYLYVTMSLQVFMSWFVQSGYHMGTCLNYMNWTINVQTYYNCVVCTKVTSGKIIFHECLICKLLHWYCCGVY